MVNCAVITCNNHSESILKKNCRVSYHTFPKNPETKICWIKATGRINWTPPIDSSYICSKHFTVECFYQSEIRRKLNPSAVPTLNLPSEVKSENDVMPYDTLNNKEHQEIRNEIEMHIKNEPHEYETTLIDDKSVIRSHVRSTEAVATIKLRKVNFYERNFVCAVCYSVFPSSAKQKRHKLTHKEERTRILYECDICLYICLSSSLLQKHKLIHCDKKVVDIIPGDHKPSFKSEKCIFANKHSYQLKKRKTTNSGEKPFKCKCCEYSTLSLKELKEHEVVHFQELPFNCDLYSYAGKHSSNLKTHKLNRVKKPLYKCDECDYTSMRRNGLKMHILTHSIEKPFKCQICDFATKYAVSLRQHKLTHSGEKPHKCDACDYACLTQYNLNVHKMIHSVDKPFKCDQCSYSSIQRRDLVAHKMLHSGKKPFECDECDYASTRLYDIKLHKKSHSDPEKYKCDKCNYTSFRHWLVKRHQMTHSTKHLFKCDQCTYTSKLSEYLKKHKMVHSGDNLHKFESNISKSSSPGSSVLNGKRHMFILKFSNSQAVCTVQKNTIETFEDLKSQNDEEESTNHPIIFKHEEPDQSAASSCSKESLHHQDIFSGDNHTLASAASDVRRLQEFHLGDRNIKDEPPECEDPSDDDKSNIKPVIVSTETVTL